ncbi:T9SS type A sorting domain-containing protein [Flavobacterium covae]|nr:T9SS type A sorting domain-containing protein [Flavobacterium covae]
MQLQNQSNNYDSISWNINNEYRTNELSPIYNFQSTGDKSITLTTRKNNCSESITKTIPIISLNLDQTKPINYDYYPNPIRDFIHIETKKNAQTKFSITDLSGKIIISEENLVKNHIDTSFLNSGIYILILNQENTISKIKLIKN